MWQIIVLPCTALFQSPTYSSFRFFFRPRFILPSKTLSFISSTTTRVGHTFFSLPVPLRSYAFPLPSVQHSFITIVTLSPTTSSTEWILLPPPVWLPLTPTIPSPTLKTHRRLSLFQLHPPTSHFLIVLDTQQNLTYLQDRSDFVVYPKQSKNETLGGWEVLNPPSQPLPLFHPAVCTCPLSINFEVLPRYALILHSQSFPTSILLTQPLNILSIHAHIRSRVDWKLNQYLRNPRIQTVTKSHAPNCTKNLNLLLLLNNGCSRKFLLLKQISMPNRKLGK